jgi:cytochrome c oxidase subunit 3
MEAFVAGSQTMDLTLGTINTALLLTSSLTMALAVHAAETSQRKTVLIMLAATIVLGCGFLAIKVVEYHHKYEHELIPFAQLPFAYHGQPQEPAMAAFFNLYFLMTGMHALHMVIGIGVLLTLWLLAFRGGLLASSSLCFWCCSW